MLGLKGQVSKTRAKAMVSTSTLFQSFFRNIDGRNAKELWVVRGWGGPCKREQNETGRMQKRKHDTGFTFWSI